MGKLLGSFIFAVLTGLVASFIYEYVGQETKPPSRSEAEISGPRSQAQAAEKSRIDQTVQVVKDLCLAGTQYDIHADAKGNIVIKRLIPGAEGSVTINAREAKGATAITNENLRIIADAEVRKCTSEHITCIIDAILSSPQSSFKEPEVQNERAKPYQEEASNIAERAAMGTTNEGQAKGLIKRYNDFVQEVKFAFGNCAYIQALQELPYFQDYHQATGAVATAAKGPAVYLRSFVPSEAFIASLSDLADRASFGVTNEGAAKGLITEYNLQLKQAKYVFRNNSNIQRSREQTYRMYWTEIGQTIAAQAKKLSQIMPKDQVDVCPP